MSDLAPFTSEQHLDVLNTITSVKLIKPAMPDATPRVSIASTLLKQ
jgi:hypothetical protein